MRPVFQNQVDQSQGDCLAACIATLLDLGPGQVPNFLATPEPPGMSAIQKANYWLAHSPLTHHLNLALVKVATDGYLEVWGIPSIMCIFSVPSQLYEGVSHAVVGRIHTVNGLLKYTILHDPNPENLPYPDDVRISHVTLLVKRH